MNDFSKGDRAEMHVATDSGTKWLPVIITRSYPGMHGGRRYDVVSADMKATAAFNVSPLSLRPIRNAHVAAPIADALNGWARV